MTVWLSANVAPSATRRWQLAQRTVVARDGSAEMTFEVTDLSEIVRWAMGFGIEARVIAPEGAVALAASTARAVSEAYR